MTISSKFILSSLFLVLPIVYLLYGVFSSNNRLIYESQKEISGIEAVQSASDAMIAVISGESPAVAYERIGQETGAVRSYFDVQDAYQQIPDLAHSSSGAIPALSNYITIVTDKSGMILDPASNTFYLMDIFSVQIPALVVLLHEQFTLFGKHQAEGSLSAADRDSFLRHYGAFLLISGNLKNDFDKVSAYSDIPESTRQSIEAFLKELDHVQSDMDIFIRDGSYHGLAAKEADIRHLNFFKQISGLSHRISDDFRGLVNQRIDGYKNERLYKCLVPLLMFLGVIIVSCFFIRRTVVGPIHKISEVLNQTIQRNLDRYQAVQFELGDVSSGVVTSLGEGRSSALLASNLSDSISSHVQNVACTFDSFSHTTSEIAGSADRAAQSAVSMAEMTGEMVQKIDELNRISESIDQIVVVINDIAEQTSLLSLNATIEATRAGDAGKGFGVVAGEVKKLSLQTKEATVRIQSQIDDIKSSVSEAKVGSDKILSKISSVVRDTEAIKQQIALQSEATVAIARSVHEAVSGTHQVNRNIHDVTSKIEGTDALSDKLRLSHQTLCRETDVLSRAIQNFSGSLKRVTG